MDFELNSEQQALRDSVTRFVERECDWDQRQAIVRSPQGRSTAHWNTFAELGWLGAGLAEEAGGFGGGAAENAIIAEQLGRALVTEPFIAHVIAAQLLTKSCGDAAANCLSASIAGEMLVVAALQEPHGRGDYRLVDTHVRQTADGWLLSGAKSLVEGGAASDRLIISARGEDGRMGLFLAEPDAPGISRRDYRTLDNRRVSDFSFDNVTLASSALLSGGDDAGDMIEHAVDHGLVAICGEGLGILDAALWATRDYLCIRKQFGVAIGSFQALQHRMADMLIEVELLRSVLYAALAAVEGADASARRRAVSAAKIQLINGGLFVAGQAIQLHGGIGMTDELNIGHFYKRIYVMARQFGDAEFHLDRFAAAADTRTD